MYNIDTCAICKETLETSETRVLPCNHSYHKECIDSWLTRVPSCPYCRTTVVIEGVTPVDTKSGTEPIALSEDEIRRQAGVYMVMQLLRDMKAQYRLKRDSQVHVSSETRPDFVRDTL
jgi:hypothetical protein